jgi:aspartate/methionine/tyrosine aminotransferase
MFGFSSRSRFTADRNQVTVALERALAEGRRVLDLTESNPTHAGLSPAGAELATLLADEAVERYEPTPFGLLSARQAIVRELAARGHTVSVEHVLLTASTSEAYGHLFKLLCDPGDAVLVPAPSYPLFDVLAQLEQVHLVPYQLSYDGEWHISTSALKVALVRAAAAGTRVRAVIVVHPNNPTGSFLKRSELAALAALGLPIVSDEVFADFALHDDTERVDSALAAAPDTLVFRLGGLSKACALPQLKLAWTVLAGPHVRVQEARQRLEHIADAYLSPGAQVQLALPRLLALGERTRGRIRERARTNLTLLNDALTDSAASVLRVEGGWYAVVRMPAVLDDEAWALTLLAQDDVLVQPGYYYELSGAHLVLSLLVDPGVMREAAARIAARIKSVLAE